MAGLIALAVLAIAVVLGAAGATWWMVPVVAVLGVAVYAWLRRERFHVAVARGGAGHLGAIVAMTYVTQCVTMAFFFAIGRGIQAIF